MLLICSLRFSYDYCLYFDSEYPLGYFLEESKFDELREFLQSRCQKKNAVNTMGESNIPMHAPIFQCRLETRFEKLSIKPQNINIKNTLKLCIVHNVRSVDKE